MAKTIKGITIEIAGDSSKLVKALDSAQKSAAAVERNLKDVNKALKLDPTNVDALAKKQDLLAKAIDATTNRLEAEKAAAEEAKKALELGNITQDQYDSFEAQIVKTQSELNKLGKEAEDTKAKLADLGGTDIVPDGAGESIQDLHDKTELLSKGLEAVAAVGDKAGEALSAEFEMAKKAADLAVTSVEKLVEVSSQAVTKTGEISYNLSEAVVENYGAYQQLVGGVEKIFDNASSTVIANADRAYRTAGMSANQYMETITGFSASLLQGLGGDTAAAARIADMALSDMSDNANTYGTDIQSIIAAYQGLAKGNVSMLDNLRLGYGGSRSELIRLINDSHILEEQISSLDDVSFDQMIMAIHAVQDELSITGTTSREAASTIDGSLNMLKASWTNFLTALGRPDVDIQVYSEQLTSSLKTVSANIKPVIERLSQQMPGLLPSMVEDLRDEIPDAVRVVGQIMNAVASAAAEAAPEVLDVAMENLPEATDIIGNILRTLSTGLRDNAPEIIAAIDTVLPAFSEVGAEILAIIIQGIIDNSPAAANALADALTPVLDQAFGEGSGEKVRELLNKIVEAGPEVIGSLLEPTAELLGTLIDKGPEIADTLIPLISFAAEHLPEITGALVALNGAGALAGTAAKVIEVAGAVQLLSGSGASIGSLTSALTGAGTAAAGAGSAATGAAASFGSIAATAGPIALLAAEVVALGYEAHALVEVVQEGEEMGISATESIVGGILTVVDTCNLGASSFSDMWYEYNRSAEEASENTQTFEQQLQQTCIDIGLSIEQSGAAATQSVADDCAIIQSYLDNLEANGQVELRARVITEYQTVLTQGRAETISNYGRDMANRYATQGRRQVNQQNWANSIHASAQAEYAAQQAAQGRAAIQAIEDTAQTAQRTIASSGGGGRGGGGGGGSSKSDDETSALTASKAEELLTSIDSHLTEVLKSMGLLTEPTEYQNNINQMIDGVLKALETGYTDNNIETAMNELRAAMASVGMDNSTVDATSLEQLRSLINQQQPVNSEAFTQMQGSVQAIQQATVDYSPYFITISDVLSQLLGLKQSEQHTFNIYVGNELLDTYIQQAIVNQAVISGGV